MQAPTSYRIAFDTNIWISFTIGKRMDKLKDIFLNKRFKTFICPQIIEEYLRVVRSVKLSNYVTTQRIIETLDLIDDFTENKNVVSKTSLSRDPHDDFLLAFSKEHRLDFLITGDNDLLVLKQYHNTRIVKYNTFIELTL